MTLTGRVLIVSIVLTTALFAGCRSQPIYEVVAAPIPATGSKAATMDDISKAIVRAGTRAGWQVIAERQGRLNARYVDRQHSATVDIEHDLKTYNLKYRDSMNLKADGTGAVHRIYNTWVQNLDRSIRNELVAITQ